MLPEVANSSGVPISSTRPESRVMMRPTDEMVESRWAVNPDSGSGGGWPGVVLLPQPGAHRVGGTHVVLVVLENSGA